MKRTQRIAFAFGIIVGITGTGWEVFIGGMLIGFGSGGWSDA